MNDFRTPSGIRGSMVCARSISKVFSYLAKRTLRFPHRPLHHVAVRSTTLCGAYEVPAITPFIWDQHLQRIRGAATYGPEQVITQDLNRKTFQFRPVVAHWLREAVLLDGSIYSKGYRHELRPVGSKPQIGFAVSGPVVEFDQAALVSTRAGSTWWGHWIEDEVPLQMLAEQFATPVAHNRERYRDESAYREAFGIAEPARCGVAMFQELLVIDEFAQNPDKTRRYHALRKKLANLPLGHERIFLSRGTTTGSRRVLVNEMEVRARLEALGFKTINVSSSSAQEVIQACRGASVVVSVEGSHLAPLLYLIQDFAALVILNPPYQVHTTVADIGVFCGISSGMFVCEPEGNSRTDFRADPEELARFVDAMVEYGKTNKPKLERFLESVMQLGTTASVPDEAWRNIDRPYVKSADYAS